MLTERPLDAEQRNHYYEVFRDVGKDMHGQSAGPSSTQRRGEDSSGKDGWRGERDREAGGGGGGEAAKGHRFWV